MRVTRSPLARLAVGVVTAVVIGLVVPPVWAAGPPLVPFAAVWQNHFVSDSSPFPDSPEFPPSGTPELLATVTVEEPLGSVPESIMTVQVNVPTGGPGTNFQIPLERKDFDHDSYFINLTKAGVPGFPIGTYTFTVSDGVHPPVNAPVTVTGFTALTPTATPTVSGTTAQTTGETTGPGEFVETILVLDSVLTPQPTVTFNRVSLATSYRVILRRFGGEAILDHVVKDSGPLCSGSTCSIKLPPHLLSPGRRYHLHINALDDPTASGDLSKSSARAQRETDLLVEGPIVQLRILGGTGAGQTLTIQARVRNGASALTLLADIAIHVPTGGVPIPIVKNLPVSIPNGLDSGFITIFSFTFTGSEPNGLYVLKLRLTNPNNGDIVADAYQAFQR